MLADDMHTQNKSNVHMSEVQATISSRFFSLHGSRTELHSQASGLMKLRRRLTVTGTSETIDGVSKLAVSEEFQKEEV